MKAFSLIMLFIVDPLIVAFISSVMIGSLGKDISAKLALKRFCSIAAFFLYFGLGVLAYFKFDVVPMYIVMFAPIALTAVVVIISLIVAPKGEIRENLDKEYKMTGWDTMFPNDIDEYDKTPK